MDTKLPFTTSLLATTTSSFTKTTKTTQERYTTKYTTKGAG
jgi:hypothetical protein